MTATARTTAKTGPARDEGPSHLSIQGRVEAEQRQRVIARDLRAALDPIFDGVYGYAVGDPRHPSEAARALIAARKLGAREAPVAAWCHQVICDFIIQDLADTRDTWAPLVEVLDRLAEYLNAYDWILGADNRWIPGPPPADPLGDLARLEELRRAARVPSFELIAGIAQMAVLRAHWGMAWDAEQISRTRGPVVPWHHLGAEEKAASARAAGAVLAAGTVEEQIEVPVPQCVPEWYHPFWRQVVLATRLLPPPRVGAD